MGSKTAGKAGIVEGLDCCVGGCWGGGSRRWDGVKGAENGLGEKGLPRVEVVETEVGRSGREGIES